MALRLVHMSLGPGSLGSVSPGFVAEDVDGWMRARVGELFVAECGASFLDDRGGRSVGHAVKWLFPDEGVAGSGGLLARRSRVGGRGLPKMKVPTPDIWKTSTCLTLPLRPVLAAPT